MIATLVAVGVTVLLAAGAAVFAYGRNVQALTTLVGEVREMRGTLSRMGERVQRLEARDEVERELSGRVRDAVR